MTKRAFPRKHLKSFGFGGIFKILRALEFTYHACKNENKERRSLLECAKEKKANLFEEHLQ